jgi:hypothetical protein
MNPSLTSPWRLLPALVLALGCTGAGGSGPNDDDSSLAANDDDSGGASDDDDSVMPPDDDDSGGASDDDDSVMPPDDALHGSYPAVKLALPQFEALNSDGTVRGPGDLQGHPTVMWFFPFAGTPV